MGGASSPDPPEEFINVPEGCVAVVTVTHVGSPFDIGYTKSLEVFDAGERYPNPAFFLGRYGSTRAPTSAVVLRPGDSALVRLGDEDGTDPTLYEVTYNGSKVITRRRTLLRRFLSRIKKP
jgi:hypothetical protein